MAQKEVHVALPDDLTAHQIWNLTEGRPTFRATCTCCNIRYAYTGPNPQYCPKHLKYVNTRGKKKEEYDSELQLHEELPENG